ncbi:MAG: hypothetical protein HWE13_02090 [Gammaproteobacteria bacterium]|nr:hypothetical protein [Gammaproteobacteria bacterium]NVK86883.1 hypothetical protein [Gammaproteobacteria bacterium]
MRLILILSSVFFIFSCDYYHSWSAFGKALASCEKYSDIKDGVSKDILGYSEGGSCMVSFQVNSSQPLRCQFNTRQNTEIAQFLMEFEHNEGSYAWRINHKKSPWEFTFERNLNEIENPIQKAIEEGACKSS